MYRYQSRSLCKEWINDMRMRTYIQWPILITVGWGESFKYKDQCSIFLPWSSRHFLTFASHYLISSGTLMSWLSDIITSYMRSWLQWHIRHPSSTFHESYKTWAVGMIADSQQWCDCRWLTETWESEKCYLNNILSEELEGRLFTLRNRTCIHSRKEISGSNMEDKSKHMRTEFHIWLIDQVTRWKKTQTKWAELWQHLSGIKTDGEVLWYSNI